MATKKFSPAQIAAQKLFAERARAGTLGKGTKRKANPSTNTGLAIYLDAIAQGDTYSESKLMEALEHPALSASDRTVIRTAIKGAPYSHIKLQDAAMKIRNYKGATNSKYNEAAVNKAIASSRSKISASEAKTIKRLLMGRTGNPDKSKPRAYVKRASQITGAPPSKRLQTRRKMALKAPAGYFPNPKAAMMTGYQVICMHPKKHVVGIFKTMAEAKMVATAMANAKGVGYGVKAVKVHKAHFAV